MKLFLNFIRDFLFSGIMIIFTILDIIGAIIYFSEDISDDQFKPYGLLVIIVSLLISSFVIYRKTLIRFGDFANEGDFIVRHNPKSMPSNIFEIIYSGNENVQNLLVKASYIDINGLDKDYIITDFYHPDDEKFIIGTIPITSLSKDDHISFRTIGSKSTLNGIINFTLYGTGIKSGNKIEKYIPNLQLRH